MTCTLGRLGHWRLQAVHVVSSVTVVTEQQLVLNGQQAKADLGVLHR